MLYTLKTEWNSAQHHIGILIGLRYLKYHMKFVYTAVLIFLSQLSIAQNDTVRVTSTDTSVTVQRTDSIPIIPQVSMQASNQTTAVENVRRTTNTSSEVYKIRNGIDIPLTAATTAYTLWGFSKIYNREQTPEAVILGLRPENVNSFDRSVTNNRSLKAKDASDKFFYGSMPLPLIFLFDKEMRKDGLKLGLLYLQAVSSFGSLYASSAMIADRFRPYTYNPAVEMGTRRGGGGRNSFFAGHPGMVATVTFFSAKVYADYHPQMRNKWILYTLAGGAAVTTGILRVKAGEHFYSDIMVGIPVGVITGLMVPHLHRNKDREPSLTVLPTYRSGQPGFHASLKLK